MSGDSTGSCIDVGGVLKVNGNLRFGEVDVGGTVEIDGNREGESVDVGGILTVRGNLTLTDELEVGGKCRIGRTLDVNRIEIGRRKRKTRRKSRG